MKKILFLLFILCLISPSFAGQVDRYETYNSGSTINYLNLNGNFDNIVNEINGGLDNTNIDTDEGFRLYEILSALPAAGSQGRTVFNSTENTLNFDSGAAWYTSISVTGTSAQGDILYHNGTSWTRLTAGTANYPLVTNGAGVNPAFEQLATEGIADLAVTNAKIANTTIDLTTKVTGLLPITNIASTAKFGYFQWTNATSAGNYAVTGVGFQPSLVVFFHSGGVTTSIGMMDGSAQYELQMDSRSAIVSTRVIKGYTDGSNYIMGAYVSLDSGGFTVTVSKSGTAPTTDVLWIAIK